MNAGPARFAALCLAVAACAPEAPAPPTDEEPPVVFRDRAEECGLVFHHTNGMSGEFYIAEVLGSGVALFDYDNDGDLDIYLVQGTVLGPGKEWSDTRFPPSPGSPPGDRLFRNDLAESGVGLRFTDVTEQAGIRSVGYGMGVVAADYDNDGWTDLYVTRWGDNTLLRNAGDGTFAEVTAESGTNDERWSVAAAFFDYDADGWLDLFVGNYVDFRYSTHKQCVPEQGFIDYCSPLAYNPEPDRLLRNRGDGRFENATGSAGLARAYGNALGAIPADFNRDGLIDLYVANDWSENQMWINLGNGRFEDRALAGGSALNADGQPEASMGVVAADFDEDGDDDLFMTHLMGETNTLYRNDGRAAFVDDSIASGLGTPSLAFTGFGAVALDYDHDGWLDLYVANGAVRLILSLVDRDDPFPFRQRDQLFRNESGRGFSDASDSLPPLLDVGRGLAAGDLDNDGDTDLVVANNQGPARLLLNETGPPRDWVGLRLLERCGRDALDARAVIELSDGTRRTRRVQTAGSYASSNDPRLLLALDGGAAVRSVRVRWPDGGVERFDAPASRRYTTLRRGEGAALEDSAR